VAVSLNDPPEDAFSAARSEMVERQLRARGITDERVLTAMGSVPRERFVPRRVRKDAYADGALPIGHGQTISQPWVVAAISAALGLRGGERVLEVGGGSGYSTAVIAELVRAGGMVRSFEIVSELASVAAATLNDMGYAEVEVTVGDGASATDDTWDAIAVHAAAPHVPEPLIKALRPGGRLVLPIATQRADLLTALRRIDDGASGEPVLERTEIAECRFVPLTGESGFSARGR
jgi:protein-L-isoaspartate(D-aspartate) O-methyltransferase